MKRISALIIGLTLGADAWAARPGQTPGAHDAHAAHVACDELGEEADASVDHRAEIEQRFFQGIAAKLGTTPDALQTAYEAAKQANPKLSRGNFVSANMVDTIWLEESGDHDAGDLERPAERQEHRADAAGSRSLGKDAEDAERLARRDAAAAAKNQ